MKAKDVIALNKTALIHVHVYTWCIKNQRYPLKFTQICLNNVQKEKKEKRKKKEFNI